MSTPKAPLGQSARLDLALYTLVLLAIAVTFQGSRGLFEPDEGRYANAALEMLRTGDWLIPRLEGLIYLDKPPAIYWSLVAGFKILGLNEWGARIGNALALVATALLVAGWSGREWGRQVGTLSGAAYVTTLLPAVAANAVTPDTLLALWTTASSLSYWQWRSAGSRASRWRWATLMGAACGLALLTKGTAGLVFLAPVVLHALWESGPRRLLRSPELWTAALLTTTVGLSWYAAVASDLPGAARYFFDNQVAGRLWEGKYDRNPQWWAPFKVYAPVLVLGTLPWSLTWWGIWRPAERSELRESWADPLHRFLALSVLLPLVVFSLAKSKLPLYILPLFPYLVMLTMARASRRRRSSWGRWVLLAAFSFVALRGIGAVAPGKHDGQALADVLLRAGVKEEECIGALGTKAHSLTFYGFSRATWHTIWPESYPYFEAPITFAEDVPALLEACDGSVHLLVDTKNRQPAQGLIDAAQLSCTGVAISPYRTLFSCSAGAGPS